MTVYNAIINFVSDNICRSYKSFLFGVAILNFNSVHGLKYWWEKTIPLIIENSKLKFLFQSFLKLIPAVSGCTVFIHKKVNVFDFLRKNLLFMDQPVKAILYTDLKSEIKVTLFRLFVRKNSFMKRFLLDYYTKFNAVVKCSEKFVLFLVPDNRSFDFLLNLVITTASNAVFCMDILATKFFSCVVRKEDYSSINEPFIMVSVKNTGFIGIDKNVHSTNNKKALFRGLPTGDVLKVRLNVNSVTVGIQRTKLPAY